MALLSHKDMLAIFRVGSRHTVLARCVQRGQWAGACGIRSGSEGVRGPAAHGPPPGSAGGRAGGAGSRSPLACSPRQRFGRAVQVALYAPNEPVLDYNMVIIFVMAVGTVAIGGYWAGSGDVKK